MYFAHTCTASANTYKIQFRTRWASHWYQVGWWYRSCTCLPALNNPASMQAKKHHWYPDWRWGWCDRCCRSPWKTWQNILASSMNIRASDSMAKIAGGTETGWNIHNEGMHGSMVWTHESFGSSRPSHSAAWLIKDLNGHVSAKDQRAQEPKAHRVSTCMWSPSIAIRFD